MKILTIFLSFAVRHFDILLRTFWHIVSTSPHRLRVRLRIRLCFQFGTSLSLASYKRLPGPGLDWTEQEKARIPV